MKKNIDFSIYSSVTLSRAEKSFLKQFENVFNLVFYDFLFKELKLICHNISFSFSICGKYKIKQLNSKHRNIKKITDVLSFSLEEDLKKIDLSDCPALELGDIYICKEVAIRQAKEANISLMVEYLHLSIHGFLHLCGYDHERGKLEEAEMFTLEEKLVRRCLAKMGVKNG